MSKAQLAWEHEFPFHFPGTAIVVSQGSGSKPPGAKLLGEILQLSARFPWATHIPLSRTLLHIQVTNYGYRQIWF
jgi:hypothetical protein